MPQLADVLLLSDATVAHILLLPYKPPALTVHADLPAG